MREFIMNLPVEAKVSIAVVIGVVLVVAVINRMRSVTLEEMRVYAYKLFVRAEKKFKEPGSGEKKMEWVVEMVKASIPVAMKPFFSDEFIRRVIQLWFDLVKDLLDDGKLNGSKEEEQEAEGEK